MTTRTPPVLDRTDLYRMIAALVADEIGRASGRDPIPAVVAGWSGDTTVDEDGVGVDSLVRLDCALRLNEVFSLHEAGLEDWLLVRRTLGDRVDIVARSLEVRSETLTFRTSGSTGDPKRCPHPVAALVEEAEAIAERLPGRRRVVALVPPQHIYGFLACVLLPRRIGVPVRDIRSVDPGRWADVMAPGDLVVGTPHLWSLTARAGRRFPADVVGLVSTAPMPAALSDTLTDLGLAGLVELYGSTETAGIGWRDRSGAPFTLFDHWTVDAVGRLSRARGSTVDLPDLVAWDGPRTFVPIGRRDGVVKIAGIVVNPGEVVSRLRQHPAVADCVVRPRGGTAPDARLEAFIVKRDPGEFDDRVEADIRRWCVGALKPAERPTVFTFGDALPRDELGKPTRW
jgi:4-coumarate--CoA ligase (photoactive yellow protein activation family)